jgi:predicted Ser/Thr protein kinase
MKDLFQQAVECEPAKRADFLRQVCAGDEPLRQELESLVANYTTRDSFLERPAYESAAQFFESQTADAEIGAIHGPYVVKQKIGEGGMGVVYLAQDTRLDRPVALKALAPQNTRDAQYRERLRREAKAAARLAHPGIATVYALEEFDEQLYIVSEYVPGETLQQRLRRGSLPVAELMDVAVQIARALTAAHEAGIVHRDLKPENIVATADGAVKILDFGLARSHGLAKEGPLSTPRLTAAGAFVGTPAYASPEQLLGADVDFRSDIFSFGVMLYELASGTHPFIAVDPVSTVARILEGEPALLSSVRAGLPLEFERIVKTCLRKERAQRYASTRALLSDLERLVSPAGSGAGNALVFRQPAASVSALWWWQFHQAFAAFGYYGMVYPLWRVKQWIPDPWDALFFFPALAAIGVAANLRFHLWFTSRFYPDQLAHQRRSVTAWVRTADALFVVLLLTGAAVIQRSHGPVAMLLVGVAVLSLVGFILIEPTTTRAAFEREGKGAEG